MEKSNFAKNEEKILQEWEEKNIFQKTLDKNKGRENFIFYEGPPTANGRPGLHHILTRAFKDVIPRYKTMCGYNVKRKAGWDTHGLPVELQVEKELGISGKPEIEDFGIEEFNEKCRQSVWKYQKDWEKLTRRIAFWLDLDDPYITYNNDYIESLWWILKQANEKDLVFEGYKVVPQCPSCGTALSSHEVAQGYKKIEENSIYMKFKIKDKKDTYFLSWTTTPWTLPGNVALAVGRDIDYVQVEYKGENLILAKALLEDVLEEEYKTVKEMKGSDLLGREYEPLFPRALDPGDKKAWYIAPADFVTTEDGTGIVHTAVMYGEDDYNFGVEQDLPFVHTVGEDGTFLQSVEKWAGKFVKDPKVEKEIIQDLNERNLLFKEKMYEHDYPFCWRCDSPLLYYAKDSWFIKMTELKQQLIDNNNQVNWVPEYIKNGRFGEWLENVKDWAISRQRYWGTPIPIWRCDQCDKQEVIGSYEELKEKTGSLPENKKGELDVHRPFIDKLTYKCSCGGEMKRTEDVFDCWFDSGSMPFAQHHYPFENKEMIDQGEQFPAEFISEAIDQTRGWFYTLLAVSTVLGKGPSYKNVICLGHIRDKDGKKMSKSKGNVIEPETIINKYGADSLRMYLYVLNQPGQPKNFDEKGVQEVLRKTVMLFGNVVRFYQMYAKENEQASADSDNILDKWILAKLHMLIKEIGNDLDNYHIYEAGRRIIDFIDELSTWYVRRSRDRFKSSGEDKEKAIKTLNYVLLNFTKVLAPFMPMSAESFYQKLNGAKDSIHLEDWPKYEESLIDQEILKNMDLARQLVEAGLSLRDEADIKVRQPLQKLQYKIKKFEPELESIIAEELNVKEVENQKQIQEQENFKIKSVGDVQVALDVALTEELKQEGLVRELTRKINNLRRKKGLTPKDLVGLTYETDSPELKAVLQSEGLVNILKQQTKLKTINPGKAKNKIKINGQEIGLELV